MGPAEDAERLDRAVAKLRRAGADVGHLLEAQLAILADARRDVFFIGCGEHPDQPANGILVELRTARIRDIRLDPSDRARRESAILRQQRARGLEERLARLGLADSANGQLERAPRRSRWPRREHAYIRKHLVAPWARCQSKCMLAVARQLVDETGDRATK